MKRIHWRRHDMWWRGPGNDFRAECRQVGAVQVIDDTKQVTCQKCLRTIKEVDTLLRGWLKSL